MNQLEELKRIHEAETGILKSKLVEQAAKINDLQTKLEAVHVTPLNIELTQEIACLKENLSLAFKDCNKMATSLSEAERGEVVVKFDAEVVDAFGEMSDDFDGFIADGLLMGALKNCQTYTVLIIKKETE